MTVEKVIAESGRKLLYGSHKGYHIIASKDEKVRKGDVVEFEPCGVNFGWFVKVINKEGE
jgi:hypothetical protein